MGVHVILDIVPQRIDPAAWAEAFDETLRLLTAHPARLLGYGFRTAAGVRVPVFTRGVEQGEPSERRWCVVGDRATLGTGERQRMYRDLGRYLARCAPEPARSSSETPRTHTSVPDDIVLRDMGDASEPPATARVFGEGDQSEPCRLPLLAAAMVIESRFPRHALVSGTFDREQAEAARRWAKGILGRALALPVRVDAWRLVERLGARFDGEALVRAVDRLFLAAPIAREAAIRRIFGRAEADAWLAAGARTDAPLSERSPSRPIGALAGLASPGELDDADRARIHALARTVRELQARSEEHGPASAATTRRAIAGLLVRSGPTLTEDAWDWIEREDDAELCAFVAALAALEPADADAAALRRALLENRALCRYAARARSAIT